jgi:hypothetical protein
MAPQQHRMSFDNRLTTIGPFERLSHTAGSVYPDASRVVSHPPGNLEALYALEVSHRQIFHSLVMQASGLPSNIQSNSSVDDSLAGDKDQPTSVKYLSQTSTHLAPTDHTQHRSLNVTSPHLACQHGPTNEVGLLGSEPPVIQIYGGFESTAALDDVRAPPDLTSSVFDNSPPLRDGYPQQEYAITMSHKVFDQRTVAAGSNLLIQSETTLLHHPVKSGEPLVQAYAVLTQRKIRRGPTPFNLTGADIVRSVRDGLAFISRDRPLHETDVSFAEANGMDPVRINSLAMGAREMRRMVYSHLLSLTDDGWSLDTIVQPPAPDGPFSRTAGPEGWYPPEGLVRIASEIGVDMTGYSVNGKKHRVFSECAPRQVDLRLLGSIEVSAVELAVVSDMQPRRTTNTDLRLLPVLSSSLHRLGRLGRAARGQ